MATDYATGREIEFPPGFNYRDFRDGGRELFGDGPGWCESETQTRTGDVPDFDYTEPCGSRVGPYIIAADFWFACDRHRLMWCVGRKVTDHWQSTLDDEQRALESVTGYKPVLRDGRPTTSATEGEIAAFDRLRMARKALADRREVAA
jgi:hypothetical protein